MHCTPSTSSFVALMATTALLASQAEALPTHRSTSAISRRAHLAAHHPEHVARDGTLSFSGRAKRTSLGDHSIVVDASTSSSTAGTTGGIRNSTINLTSISRRNGDDRESTFSSFARVVRSLFGASSSDSALPSRLPLTVSPSSPSHSTTRKRHAKKGKRTTKPSTNVARLPHAQRAVAIAGAKAPRSLLAQASRAHNHVRNVKAQQQQVQAVKRAPKPATLIPAALVERAIHYTDAADQAAAYSSAVAALGDDQPQMTASPVIAAVVASPSASVAAYSSSPLAANAAYEPVSVAASSSSSSVAESADRPPITMTVTLVPSGPNGAYIDAAGLAAPAPTASSSSSASVDGASNLNPKASSSAAESAEEPLSTLVLPSSPPPSTHTASVLPTASASASPAAGLERQRMVKRVNKSQASKKKAARKVHVGGSTTAAPAVQYYHAPY
ncbi:hypothetical protein JCM8097_001484 [Rhodosporidiobolus ruineniae]